MEILVDQILDEKEKIISFESESGSGFAFWIGKLPVEGEKTHVELSLDEALTGQDIQASSATKSAIERTAEGFLLTGQVVGPIAEGILPLEIGDGVVLVEVSESVSEPEEGTYVVFKVKELNFFPMDL